MVAVTDSLTDIFHMFMKGQGIEFPVQAYMVVELTPLTRISTLPAGLPAPLRLFFRVFLSLAVALARKYSYCNRSRGFLFGFY